ncbi:sterol desaturase family protein [Candidatus Seongchinamella marina]|uniref:sterol desaturase family protein n=1 Tax=Candidatus Seongchinamella marina TaxID=2518990 RepID=UPI00243167F2|nr:sterol desaturase family protein [Candidatus Seongchinamella marina]
MDETFSSFVAQHEIGIRLVFFLGIFILMATWEFLAPCRPLSVSKVMRWTNNWGVLLLNTLALRLIFPAAALGSSIFATQYGWGILNHFQVTLPWAVLLSLVALDLTVYLQHVLVHAVPSLWRLHRVHHADLDYDITTGSRFHPLEIIISMLIKIAVILALGAPVLAVFIFEIVLSTMSTFNHGNVRLPPGFDRVVRLFVVTPDMHRVHHSIEDNEANSNFGFNLSIWDRLFGTYVDQPRDGHVGMTIGIHYYREPRQVSWLPGMLALPFAGKVRGYAINRRDWSKGDD